MSTTSVRGTIRGLGTRANPAFATGIVVLPIAALAYVAAFGTVQQHTYVHVMAGILWTGIDLFMALVLGPVLGGLDLDERASFFERLTPKTTFLLPTLALVTIAGGVTLALRIPYLFDHPHVWLAILTALSLVPALALVGWQLDVLDDWRWQAWFGLAVAVSGAYLAVTLPNFAWTEPVFVAAILVVAALSVLGFGVLMPGEIRMYREMTSANPDKQLIADIGMRNAKLGGVQGVLQLVVVATMVYIRYGGF